MCEEQGIWAGKDDAIKGWVEVAHLADGISVTVRGYSAVCSPEAARALARMLYRQARRWESARKK